MQVDLRGSALRSGIQKKSDGNPCFGVRGSKRTSTENTGKPRFFCPPEETTGFPGQ